MKTPTSTLKTILFLVFLLSFWMSAQSQVYKTDEPFAHTFSIVARDANTGEMAVGVQSHWFSVGSIVSWGKSGVGVVATQSFVNPACGPGGLKLMESGLSPEEALNQLLNEDPGKAVRQVAFLNTSGKVAVHTGASCIAHAGHAFGVDYSVQANMMLTDRVVAAMEEAFTNNPQLPLAERVVGVLKAAQLAGGDIRGKQSAALLVVGPNLVDNPWEDKRIDLRVDDHSTPIEELARLLTVHRAYEYMNQGDLDVEHGDMKAALKSYGKAEALFPENLEMKYWKAVALASNGKLEEALPIFKVVFDKDENWRELTRRLPAAGLLQLEKNQMAKILSL